MKIMQKFENNGVEYEIRLIAEANGKWFLSDFKQNKPFSPFRYSVDRNVDIQHVGDLIRMPIMTYLISQVKGGITFWVENKDKIGIF